MWFLEQLSPGSAAYNLHAAFALRGALDVEALERAFDVLVARHESLRTRFTTRDGEPVQVIDAAAERVLAKIDARRLDEQAMRSELARGS